MWHMMHKNGLIFGDKLVTALVSNDMTKYEWGLVFGLAAAVLYKGHNGQLPPNSPSKAAISGACL